MAFILIPLIMIPHVHSFGMLLFAALLIGMSGTSFAVGVSYASVWFPPEQQGLALGIVSMGNMGNAVAAMTLPYISKAAGFDSVYYFLIILTVIFGVLLQSFVRKCRLIKSKTIKGSIVCCRRQWNMVPITVLLSDIQFICCIYKLNTNVLNRDVSLYSCYCRPLFSIICFRMYVKFVHFGGYLADRKRPMALLQWVFVANRYFCYLDYA